MLSKLRIISHLTILSYYHSLTSLKIFCFHIHGIVFLVHTHTFHISHTVPFRLCHLWGHSLQHLPKGGKAIHVKYIGDITHRTVHYFKLAFICTIY